MKNKHFDVIIVGAGVSGIGVGCHLTMKTKKSFTILERRQAIGGTWDLFKYPGIRSDSDMLTFGYEFRPWEGSKILADGPSIKQYVIDTAKKYGIDKKIQYGRKVTKLSWSSTEGLWTIESTSEDGSNEEVQTAKFMINCSGYYDYDLGHRPHFPGEEKFKGKIIHPQHWPEDLDYADKKITIIGSGATAITLVPSMAPTAGHVTMLQRSPAYIASVPSEDAIVKFAGWLIPNGIIHGFNRLRNIYIQQILFWACKQKPSAVRNFFLNRAKAALGDSVDMKHFTPRYDPWEQRLCVVPDGNFFEEVKKGRAGIVTDDIDTFTENGIKTKNGTFIESDIIVTATGLNMRLLGGADLYIDGEPIRINEKLTYKGVLVQDIPNGAVIFGYANASWTLKVDIAAEYICRLLNHMNVKGITQVIPRDHEGCRSDDESVFGLSSGYIRRAQKRLPAQGTKAPWRVTHNYLSDSTMLKYSPIEDKRHLEFIRSR